jgi:hypothetical protein
VETQFGVKVKILRTDNVTEYTNREFVTFLFDQGIIHQTTCPDTLSQNGIAEWKNRYLLKVARSLMLLMNVPKRLWSEAIMTVGYLINRISSRVLGIKTPYELLFGVNEFIVPPRVFECTCFERDYRLKVGKLDPWAVQCIFV